MTNANEPYVYADSAATTPLSPRALEAMMPYLTTKFGNPSGIHRMARETASALDGARNDMARLLGAANASDIFFTSGGSESDNWILRGAVQRYRDLYGAATPVRIVTSAIEHHAILHCCEALEREGVQVTHLPVDRQGLVHAEDLEEALTANERAAACGIEAPGFAAAPGHTTASAGGDAPGLATPPATALVSIMLANNEVGTIEPIRELAAVAHAHGAPFHTDAVQAVGHIPVDVQELGIDALSLSAHKFHGPRGVGALYLRKGFSIPPLITGGAQERGERAGTENVAGIVGMVTALEEACETLRSDILRISSLRDELVRHLLGEVEDMALTGTPIKCTSADGTKTPCTPACDASALPDRNAPVSRATDDGATGEPSGASDGEALDCSPSIGRLPSIASFTCDDVDGELLVVLLDRAGVAAATGSACSTGSTEPSHVLTAMGIPRSAPAVRCAFRSRATSPPRTSPSSASVSPPASAKRASSAPYGKGRWSKARLPNGQLSDDGPPSISSPINPLSSSGFTAPRDRHGHADRQVR